MILNIAYRASYGHEMAGEGFLHWLIDFGKRVDGGISLYLMGYREESNSWLDQAGNPAVPDLVVAAEGGVVTIVNPVTKSSAMVVMGMTKQRFMASIGVILGILNIELRFVN